MTMIEVVDPCVRLSVRQESPYGTRTARRVVGAYPGMDVRYRVYDSYRNPMGTENVSRSGGKMLKIRDGIGKLGAGEVQYYSTGLAHIPERQSTTEHRQGVHGPNQPRRRGQYNILQRLVLMGPSRIVHVVSHQIRILMSSKPTIRMDILSTVDRMLHE